MKITAKRRAANARIARVWPPRAKPTRRRPAAVASAVTNCPSAEQVSQLRAAIERRIPYQDAREGHGRERRVSRLFAAELRKRGWLHEEGYAPGSWAAELTERSRNSPTDTQIAVLEFMRSYQAKHGQAPMLSEMCAALGIAGYSTIQARLKSLRAKGLVTCGNSGSRNWSVVA